MAGVMARCFPRPRSFKMNGNILVLRAALKYVRTRVKTKMVWRLSMNVGVLLGVELQF